MDDDNKELVRRLMANATAMLEDTVETAVAGQSERLSAPAMPAPHAASKRPRRTSRSSPKPPRSSRIRALSDPGIGGNAGAERAGLPGPRKRAWVPT